MIGTADFINLKCNKILAHTHIYIYIYIYIYTYSDGEIPRDSSHPNLSTHPSNIISPQRLSNTSIISVPSRSSSDNASTLIIELFKELNDEPRD
jgi:hypothetical protein